MKHRDRVLMAVSHEEPDRVPFTMKFTPEMEIRMLERMGLATGDLFRTSNTGGLIHRALNEDLLITRVGPVTSFYLRPEQEYLDEWGVRWRWIDHGREGRYTEIAEHPLRDLKDPGSYTIPDFGDKERYAKARETVDRFGDDYAIVGGMPCTLFELSWFLRGMERVMEDMLTQKDFYHCFLDRLLVWALAAGKSLVEAGVDIIWLGDDFGSQDRMLISPQLFREFFKPRYAEIVSTLREIKPSVLIAFHSDGSVGPIVRDFVDIGIDILNPIQPKCMDPRRIKEEFGRELTLWGTIDNQAVLPFGTVQDVIDEVRLRINTLAGGGGLILSPAHSIQPQTSLPKVAALLETVSQYAAYPIRA